MGRAANSAALFRARLRREWAAADGAWQAQATLIIDGHWGERLRRTSWQRVTRGTGVPLWPGPQSRPAAEWRAEEKEQKAAFHAHWAAHAREIPFAHSTGSRAAALAPLRVQIGSPDDSGGGGALDGDGGAAGIAETAGQLSHVEAVLQRARNRRLQGAS